MRHGFVLACAAALAIASSAASAHIRYDFTAVSTAAFPVGNTFTASISITLPSFFTDPDPLDISSLSTCSVHATREAAATCSSSFRYLGIYGDAPFVQDIVSLGFDTSKGLAGFDFGFADTAFSTLGHHNSVARFANDKDIGTLDVTDLDASTVPAVPEPATWTTLLAGCGLIGWAMRRRQTAPTLLA